MLIDIKKTKETLEAAIATPADHAKTRTSPAVEVKRDVVVTPPPPLTVLVTVDREMVKAEDGFDNHPAVTRNYIQVVFTGLLTETDPDTLWQLFNTAHRALVVEGWTLSSAEAMVADRQEQPLHVLLAKYDAVST